MVDGSRSPVPERPPSGGVFITEATSPIAPPPGLSVLVGGGASGYEFMRGAGVMGVDGETFTKVVSYLDNLKLI